MIFPFDEKKVIIKKNHIIQRSTFAWSVLEQIL